MKNKKYGVSLMTLIITIVIMSILTGTIIISITNSNTIDNAKDAVKRYTLAEVTHFANIAYGEAVMDKLTNTEEILKFIKSELKEYGIDIAYYKIALNGNKVTVANRESEPWKFKKDSSGVNAYVTNGDVTLAVGDIVHYDETKGGTKTGLTNVDWRVLGANEDGDLLLMASDSVQRLSLRGQEGYILGVDKLNKISREYGYGYGATYARSITVEDVNELLQVKQETGLYKFYWDGDEYPYYEYIKSDGTVRTGDLTSSHANGFYYNDTYSPYPGNSITGKQLIVELEYKPERIHNLVIHVNDKIKELLDINDDYWFASKYFEDNMFGLNESFFYLYECIISTGEWWLPEELFYTYGTSSYTGARECGVRPVVIMDSDVELDKASDGVWDIK